MSADNPIPANSKLGLWFRVYCDIGRNPKLRLLSESLQLRYIWILALHKEGHIAGKTVREMAWHLRMDEGDLTEDVEALKNANLLKSDMTPKGWSERQFESDSSTGRVKKLRENASKPVDDTAWLAQIKTEYFKIGVDVDAEMVKARAWLTTPKGKGRSFTQRFFVAWLNRADRNVTLPLGSGNAGGNKTPATPAGPKAWMDMTSDEREQALIKKREDKNNQSRRENDQEVLTMPWEFPRKTVAAVRKQWQDRAAAGGSYSKNFLAKIEAEQAANPHENPDGWDTPPKRKSLETLADSPAPEKKKPFGYIDPNSV